MPENHSGNKIGLFESISIGIGGMVGGGIFAVLGLTVELAHGGAIFSFLLAGIVSLLTAYSYAKLSLLFPHEGGTVEFINRGLRHPILSGSLNFYLWLCYIVMIALYANAFGNFGIAFHSKDSHPYAKDILIISIILGSTLLNILDAKIIGKSEMVIVFIKLLILVGIVLFGFHVVMTHKLDYSRLAFSNWSSLFDVIAGGFLIFLAYEGFELIANAAEDISNPKKNLPLAYSLSVIAVIIIYMLAGAITAGILSIEEVSASRDFVLAVVAKKILNTFGFNMVIFAALLSTFSAVAATLYANTRLTRQLAHAKQFPHILKKEIFHRPVMGLLVTSSLALCLALIGGLDDIATLGSIGFLTVFFIVNLILNFVNKLNLIYSFPFSGC